MPASPHPVPEPLTPDDDPRSLAAALTTQVATAVRGKPDAVRLALVALLSGGHLLVEDVPGTGKTLLARALAAALGGRFRRVQCTPDLLPADVTGTAVYGPSRGEWEFRPGPVFANVVLVDEVNRASPRTQAALLEPMEEHQVSVDGVTHRLPEPFFLVATQNPFGQAGTFPLPESQLDRFGVVLTMGLPDRDAEREILTGTGGADALGDVLPVASPEAVQRAVVAVRHVHCTRSVVDYVLDLAHASRAHPDVLLGASPRAALGLLHAARAHATIAGRDFVSPDDVKGVAAPVLAHRLVLGPGADLAAASTLVADLLRSVAVPGS
jgi:MoxR-like ATPase